MRFLTLFLSLALPVLAADAAPITREQARQAAEAFLAVHQPLSRLTPVAAGRMLSPRRRMAASAVSEYYVFNKGDDGGYVIVSGDDQTEPILGYCDTGEFDYDALPPAMQEWLDGYARQIEQLQRGGIRVSDAVPTHAKVPELMKSKWSQGYPYNLSCPQYFTLGQSVTGCVATAMAQILYYNREKSVSETTAAMPAYDTWTSHATYGRLHVEGIPEGSPIDWENMKDTYGSATEKQRKAVADLMHYCGVAVKMDYTNSSSGAQSYDAYQAFAKYFGYGSSVRYVSYENVTSDTEWDRIIYAEIAAGRPVYVSGANAEAGHAFVADGYDGNLKYHINWGWGGTSDGYYLLTNLTPGQQGIGGSSDGYNAYREIIVGIEPENYGEKAMTLSDATVRKICLAQWDADGDGKFTYGEAAAVSDIGTAFQGAAIKTFKELYYFTGLTALADDAFNGCRLLTSLRLPKNVSTIGDRSLKDCAKLTQLELPNRVKTIGAEAFSGCSALTALALPDELPAVADGTFSGCSALTAVSLPVSVTAIGAGAFARCSKLRSFTLRTFQPSALQLSPTAFDGTDLSAATLYTLQGTRPYLAAADVWRTFGSIVEQRELSGGQFAQLEAGRKYYLYHVGTGQYLTKGEAWGTQAVVGDSPMRFVVNHTSAMPEGTYYLTSEDTGRSGTLLFRTMSDNQVGAGVKATFVDGTLASNRANAYWAIAPVADGVYTIQIPAGAAGYEAGRYWGVQSSHRSDAASPTYGVYGDVSYDEHPAGCQWRFVAYDEAQVARYEAAQQLGRLLTIAEGRRLQVGAERDVYDRLESTTDELLAAQRSLRKKLKFVDFADDGVRKAFISAWDIDSDGELSLAEASKVTDLQLSFQGNTTLSRLDELQYLTAVPDIYGSTFENCTALESVTLPESILHIYYRAFRNCQKLAAIAIPGLVSTLGDNCFQGCRSLRSVTVACADPAAITLGSNVFGGVPLSSCTLYVPFGAKPLYEQAPVWQDFGQIVEVRMRTQPRRSPAGADVAGYLCHLGSRRYLAVGEAYGTQSVVAAQGARYQLKRNKSMAEGLYYLYNDETGKVLFRTSTDTKVGDGVKACFADGDVSAKAYWKLDSVAPGVYTLQVPPTDADYVAGEYLGVDEAHASGAASPTYGVYYDIQGTGLQSQWAFISADDMAAAQFTDEWAARLKALLATAAGRQLDVAAEQAVYDDAASTTAQLAAAVGAVRQKLHYITFADERVMTLCTAQWDADGDGELSFEEAAAVSDIGSTFTNMTAVKSFEELRYFTALSEIPADAFRGASSLHTIFLPAGVTSVGSAAFRNCSLLRNVVILNDSAMIPYGTIGLPGAATVFVPGAVLAAYEADPEWSQRCAVTEYTGRPVVTAVATRIYGRTTAIVSARVMGAPVQGTPEFTCDAIKNATLPVGTYPIAVAPGSITTPGVECREGVLTVTPATLTLTARSYRRAVGEPNPDFGYDIKGFRNRETDTVVVVRPRLSCEATAASPAGDYAIVASGAEARNYVFIYVDGVLTVADPTGVAGVADVAAPGSCYDLQGRRVERPRRGVYVSGRRKVVVK